MCCIITARNNMNSLKEELRLFLCPNVSPLKLKNRCVLIKQQLCLETSCDLVVDSPKECVFVCEVCGNNNERHTLVNENEGMQVCLGQDGNGCGHVLYTNRFTTCYAPMYDDVVEELFSVQADFPSQYKYGCKKYKRLNNCIERDLSRYGRDDAITGDFYKDEQRKEAYDILDRVQMSVAIDKSIIQVTKIQFHKFREKMYRIHKLEMALCCLLYIALNDS